MPTFTESNITLQFPDENYSRFEDCLAYKRLGNNFKEMDFIWYDSQQNLYWLFEVKDFTSVVLDEKQTIADRTNVLVKKSVDCLCMMLSAKHGYNSDILSCFPVKPNAKTQFKFVSIIHCANNQKEHISSIHHQFRLQFKPYAELFGVKNYGVMEHSQAKRSLSNFVQ